MLVTLHKANRPFQTPAECSRWRMPAHAHARHIRSQLETRSAKCRKLPPRRGRRCSTRPKSGRHHAGRVDATSEHGCEGRVLTFDAQRGSQHALALRRLREEGLAAEARATLVQDRGWSPHAFIRARRRCVRARRAGWGAGPERSAHVVERWCRVIVLGRIVGRRRGAALHVQQYLRWERVCPEAVGQAGGCD